MRPAGLGGIFGQDAQDGGGNTGDKVFIENDFSIRVGERRRRDPFRETGAQLCEVGVFFVLFI